MCIYTSNMCTSLRHQFKLYLFYDYETVIQLILIVLVGTDVPVVIIVWEENGVPCGKADLVNT